MGLTDLATSPSFVVEPITIRDVSLSLNGGYTWTTFDTFVFYAPPQVFAVTPKSGPKSGATAITISGSGFFDTGVLNVQLADVRVHPSS